MLLSYSVRLVLAIESPLLFSHTYKPLRTGIYATDIRRNMVHQCCVVVDRPGFRCKLDPALVYRAYQSGAGEYAGRHGPPEELEQLNQYPYACSDRNVRIYLMLPNASGHSKQKEANSHRNTSTDF